MFANTTMLVLLVVSLCVFSAECVNETVLNAVVLGHKGLVDVEKYVKITEALEDKTKTSYCRIDFRPLEYDSTDGKSVYDSLQNARATFEDSNIAVAIGPQIDVFTSTDYVILHQVLFVTSSDEMIEPANRTMPILPDPKSLSDAIATAVDYLEWTKVAFLSQDDFSPVLALGGKGVFVSPIRLPSNLTSSCRYRNGRNNSDAGNCELREHPQLQQTLTTLRESQMDKFILHSMKKEVVQAVLMAAQKLHLLHHSIRWFITYLDFDEIVGDIQGTAKVYGLQLLVKENFPTEISEIFDEESRLEQALMVDVVGLLRHYLEEHTEDCSIEPADNTSITAHQFKEALGNATGRLQIYRGALGAYSWPKLRKEQTSNTRKEYAIPLYRKIDKNEMFAEVVFRKDEIKISRILSKKEPLVESAFRGKTFDVIAKRDEPFVMKTTNGYEGFCVDVLKELSSKMDNFNYRIFEINDNSPAENGKTSKWDKIIDQLKVGNASMAIGAFAVTADREERISFSYTIMSSSVSLLLKRSPDTTNYFQFLGPFSQLLWLMIVVFFLVVGFGLYFMARFDSTQAGSDQKFDFRESMWYSLTILLQGTAEYSPETTSMRTIVAFFWFCTLVINAAYTANLAAFLTLQQIDDRVTSVDDMARQSKVKYGVLNNSDLMHFFQSSREDPYERMWAFMKLNEEVSLLQTRFDGLRYVMNGVDGEAYIYLDDGVINNYYAQKNCEFESIQQNFGVKHFSIGFPKGAPYRSDINGALLALKEDGTLDRLRDRWWDSKSNCTQQISDSAAKANSASELDISNMFGVFIVLIAFTVLAVLYEIGMCIFKCVRERNRKKNAEGSGTPEEKPHENSVQFAFGEEIIKN
ncbi:hypothetical protein ACF0H5_015747 [Mactra antiquata]